MAFLIDGDALSILSSALLALVLVVNDGGLPCSWVVQISWPR